jgi:hypothetical protein
MFMVNLNRAEVEYVQFSLNAVDSLTTGLSINYKYAVGGRGRGRL